MSTVVVGSVSWFGLRSRAARGARMRLLAWVGLIGFAAGASEAAAQAGVICANADKLGTTQIRTSQQYGRVQVEVSRPNGAGKKLDIEYGNESYATRLEGDGRARISFALTQPKAEFSIRLADFPALICTAEVADFAKLYRVILRWHDPVQIDLHVIEPSRRMGEFGHVSPARPNSNLAQGLGQMDIFGAPPQDGPTNEMSYVVADASAIPADGVYGFRAEFVTRGMKPQPPYCGDQPLAVPQMELIIIDKGAVSSRKVGTNRAPCGETIPENRRFMVLRQ